MSLATDQSEMTAEVMDHSDRHGVIVAHYGVAVEVAFVSGERCAVRIKRRSGHVIGDDVIVKGEVLQRLPRRTELRRRDATGHIHLLAANLDLLGIVIAPLPVSPPNFIDRAIVSARAADLTPFLVVNKIDLESTDLLAALNDTYAPSLSIFSISAKGEIGLEPLRSYFKAGHRGAFVGTTGVGKSSLLNALCPDVDLRVGGLNDYNDKGCHTTTVSTLHALPDGGELVDTPGFQDFGFVEISTSELAAYFPGFENNQAGSCRFRNCRHRSEPGCAVMERVINGDISAQRYQIYLELLDEVEAEEVKTRKRGWKN